MGRIELADALTTHRATDAWGAILEDSAFDKPELVWDDAPVYEGDLANIHRGMYNGQVVAVKITRDEGDNDLTASEADVLRALYPPGTPDEKFYRYLPRMLLWTRQSNRQVNVFPWYSGFVSLEEIHRAYPAGIDFRDVVWMFKRLLVGIGFAHDQDFVHGAILPPHVLVHPTDHGAKIIDWSYAIEKASRKDAHVLAISKNYRAFYAPEILNRRPPTAATDVFMAAKCAIQLLGGNVTTNILPLTVPIEIASFFADCVQENASRRPQNAWDLHKEFDLLLQKLVGKPVYRPFRMP